MADVIGVMEVLHLKCGVSVSKRQHSECDWEPDRVRKKYHNLKEKGKLKS